MSRWFVQAIVAFGVAAGCGGEDGNPANPPCTPQCAERQCGDDGCGGSCGDCEEGLICDAESGTCYECQPDCEGRDCGDDGCGGSCGECGDGWSCNEFVHKCVGGCTADCTGKTCGSDGCSGSCGDCDPSRDCFEGLCVAKASCTDGKTNGTESDVDCGGTCPDRCAVGKACKTPPDCGSGDCKDGVCQADLTCENGSKDPGETDTDCGGPKCSQCPLTKFCKVHLDCLSLACIFGVCSAPTCDDGAKNQDESDVDCGGKCPGCVDGKYCQGNGDCESGDCGGGTCISCGDGLKNGTESDVDCGGKCGPCLDGKHCGKPVDCESGACEGGTCCSPNACGECTTTPVEVCDGKDNDCDGKTDDGLPPGELCPKQDGVCKGSKQQCVKGVMTCDASVYLAFNSAYQVTESKCDDKDNDCNGKIDEPPQCCEPQCSGKECGDDGCGGECGPCSSDTFCLAAQCMEKGVELWNFLVEGYTITTTPVMGLDGTIYVTTDFPFQLVAITPDGKKDWAITAPQDSYFGNLHIGKGGVLIARTTDGLVWLDPANGKKKWDSAIEVDKFSVAKDGTVVATASPAGMFTVLAIGATGGDALWTAPLVSGSEWWFYSTPAIAADGTIYVAAPDEKLYALDKTGKVKWSKTFGARTISRPPSPPTGPSTSGPASRGTGAAVHCSRSSRTGA
jgi:outer membrane protein assembly factor BamB